MRLLVRHAERRATARVSAITDALIDAAGDLPGDLAVERIREGVAIRGPGLVRRLAFDGRLRGLTLGLRSDRT